MQTSEIENPRQFLSGYARGRDQLFRSMCARMENLNLTFSSLELILYQRNMAGFTVYRRLDCTPTKRSKHIQSGTETKNKSLRYMIFINGNHQHARQFCVNVILQSRQSSETTQKPIIDVSRLEAQKLMRRSEKCVLKWNINCIRNILYKNTIFNFMLFMCFRPTFPAMVKLTLS